MHFTITLTINNTGCMVILAFLVRKYQDGGLHLSDRNLDIIYVFQKNRDNYTYNILSCCFFLPLGHKALFCSWTLILVVGLLFIMGYYCKQLCKKASECNAYVAKYGILATISPVCVVRLW